MQKTTPMDKIEFKKLQFGQVVDLIGWAENEGWNPGKQDAQLFWEADSDGFYGIFIGNEMIGGGALISYNGKFGSMGLFIVKPAYRGEGYGSMMWFKRRDTLLSRLEQGAAIGLDGVVPMQPFYAKGGFNIAFRDIRFQRKGEFFTPDGNVLTYTVEDKEELTSYDWACMGYERNSFLHPWVNQQNGKTFIYREEGFFKGYAVIRSAVTGMRIGPLFADQEYVAESLYKACLTYANGQEVFIDVPSANTVAVSLFERFEANQVFECARMYYGTPPAYDINRLYGLTTLELG